MRWLQTLTALADRSFAMLFMVPQSRRETLLALGLIGEAPALAGRCIIVRLPSPIAQHWRSRAPRAGVGGLFPSTAHWHQLAWHGAISNALHCRCRTRISTHAPLPAADVEFCLRAP